MRMTGEVWLRSELQWTNLAFVLRSVDCQRGRERQIRLAALWAVDYGDEGVQLFAFRAGAENFDDVGAGFEGYGGGEYAGYVNGYGYAIDGDDCSRGGASDEGDGGMDCKGLVQRLGNY